MKHKWKLIIAASLALAIWFASNQFRNGSNASVSSSDSTLAQSQNSEAKTAGIKLHVTTSNDLAK